MNWQEFKTSLLAFFERFSIQFIHQEEPLLKPIPIPVERRSSRDQ